MPRFTRLTNSFSKTREGGADEKGETMKKISGREFLCNTANAISIVLTGWLFATNHYVGGTVAAFFAVATTIILWRCFWRKDSKMGSGSV